MNGIYKITSPSNNIYIGQSCNINRRFREYSYLKCKNQPALYSSFIKYGVSNHKFEIIHELPFDVSQEIVDNYENLYWIMYINCNIHMLNLKEPKGNGRFTQESKLKVSDNKSSPICQFSQTGEFIKEWKSVRRASEELNIPMREIRQSINAKKKINYTFNWCYAKKGSILRLLWKLGKI